MATVKFAEASPYANGAQEHHVTDFKYQQSVNHMGFKFRTHSTMPVR